MHRPVSIRSARPGVSLLVLKLARARWFVVGARLLYQSAACPIFQSSLVIKSSAIVRQFNVRR